jgi:WD40 repeat protein
MTEPSAEQFGGVLAAPTPRQRRGDIATMAGAALAVAFAAVALTVIHPAPPRGLIATLSGPAGQATCSAAFSPDSRTLAVADCNDSVSLWDVATRRWIATLASPGCPDGGQVVFSPDGTMLATNADFGYGTCLYDVTTRNRLATLTDPGGQPDQAAQVAFSPDGTMIVVTDSNGRTYLWHVRYPQRR